MSSFNEIEKNERKHANYAMLMKSLMHQGELTIPELAQAHELSIPTVTKLVNGLVQLGYVVEKGKRERSHGRFPSVYALSPSSGYFLGVDPGCGSLNMALCDFSGELVDLKMDIPFEMENTADCLEKLVVHIRDYMAGVGVDSSKILKVALNISGRVNPFEGISYSIFNFLDQPLAQYLTRAIGVSTCIENDTRAMTYGEYLKGNCKGVKNVVFVNVSWGIAIGIIINGELYFGNSGFSGEFGHVRAYDNEKLCRCGKKGCLETEVSGMALLRETIRRVMAGERSILSDKLLKDKATLTLTDVLDAIVKEDVLCIDVLQKMSGELGKNLAGIINILNPQMLVIGGDLSQTGDYITQPVGMAIKKYSLNIVNEDSEVVTSALAEQAGVIGACMVARSRVGAL